METNGYFPKILKTVFCSPYLYHSLAWILVLICYFFGWSKLLPKLDTALLISLIISIYLFLVFFIFSCKLEFQFDVDEGKELRRMFFTGVFSLVLYLIEALVYGGIPLLMILKGTFDYDIGFGLPFIHVFINAICSINCSSAFLYYQITNNKKFILYFLFFLFPGIFTFTRSYILYNFFYCIVIFITFYFVNKRRIFIGIVGLILLGCILLIFFGIAGDIRSNSSDGDYISEITYPTEKFEKTNLPSSVLWAYCYITTPLGNLQNTINENGNFGLHERKDLTTFFYYFMPDMIIKRLFDTTDKVRLVVPYFNVSSFYADIASKYGYLGILYSNLGLIIMVAFTYFIKKTNSIFSYLSFVYLSTILFFNIFDNMFNFMGLAPQYWLAVFLSFNYEYIFKYSMKVE